MAQNDIDKAVKEVDRMEDEAAKKRQEEADAYEDKDEDDVIICPKCKSLVNEQDFLEDEVTEMAPTSIMSKINCSKCGYIGLPVEVSKEEYLKYGSKPS
jgi:phage FluMu protein Com